MSILTDEELFYAELAVAVEYQWFFRGDTLTDNLPSYRMIAQAQKEKTDKEWIEWIEGNIVANGYYNWDAGCATISISVKDWQDRKEEVRE